MYEFQNKVFWDVMPFNVGMAFMLQFKLLFFQK